MVDYSKALSKSGLDTLESGRLIYDLSGATNLKALLNKLDSNPKISSAAKDEIIVSLGRKYKADPNIIDKLEADLKSNPSLSTKLEQNVVANPTGFMKALLPAYTGGNLSQAITAAAPPVVVAQPTPTNTPKATATEPAATPSARTAERQQSNKTAAARTKPAVAPAPVSVAVATPSEPRESVAQTEATPTVTQQASTPSEPESNQADSGQNDALAKLVFEKFADANDKDISSRVDSNFVKSMATGLSKDAVAKFGVSKSTADGFANRIKSDSKLAQDIATNLQNNPGLVRQMAKMSKDTSELKEPAKSMAQSEMNKLMSNPELLADAKYVQGLQQKMQMAEQLKNGDMMGMFKSFFGGNFGSGFGNIGKAFAGFSGPYQVFSMSKNGGGFFPSVMVNLDNMRRNEAASYAWGTTSARDMTAMALGGQAFKTEITKGPDGKDVKTQVPNTLEVTTADGKKVKVIPAVGVLVAQQEKGRFDPDTQQFIPGNIRVPVVTGVDGSGDSSAVTKITMTPAEFAKYQAVVNETSAKYGDGRKLAFEPYTAEDLRNASRGQQIQVARVDAKTGSVTEQTITTPPASTIQPNGNGVQTYPVAPQRKLDERELSPISI